MTLPLIDTLNRPLEALRISVTDRCNLRCSYCMPKAAFANHAFLENDQLLSFDEITLLAEILVGLGVKKIRVTGGEPLLRPQINDLIHRLARLPGSPELALSTNGLLLSSHARALRQADLSRINVSLDALNDATLDAINGAHQSVSRVLEGIDAALEENFIIKVNMVVQRGVNEDQILPMTRYFAARHLPLRFIEFMDVGNCNEWNRERVVPGSEILNLLQKEYRLEQEISHPADVERRFRCQRTGARFGFINSITAPFCRGCNRLRLSANGSLYTCLFAREGHSLRHLLRTGVTREELGPIIRNIWQKRDDRYSEIRSSTLADQPSPRVEMSFIGG